MTRFTEQLNWRNATKKFDATKPIAQSELEKVCEAIRFTPTSFGLQPFYVKIVKNQEVKAQLQAAGWGQAQFTTSTAVLVFVARTQITARIDQMLNLVTGGNAAAREQMKDYESMMKGSVGQLPLEGAKIWAQKQCYIALGFAMAACAELKIASCPMEGFSAPDFDKILKLPAGEFSTVVLTVGHPAPDFQPFPKFRFPESDLFQLV
jgi:nitroreductase